MHYVRVLHLTVKCASNRWVEIREIRGVPVAKRSFFGVFIAARDGSIVSQPSRLLDLARWPKRYPVYFPFILCLQTAAKIAICLWKEVLVCISFSLSYSIQSQRMSTNERFENFHLNCEKPRGVLKAFLVGAEISLDIAFNCAIFLEKFASNSTTILE